MVNELGSISEVSRLTGIDDSTISLWLKNWNAGNNELKSQRGIGGGRKEKLSEEEKESLIKDLKNESAWTTAQIMELIKNKFNIEYSDWHICSLMRKFGMKLAKPYQEDYRKPLNAEEILEVQLKSTFELLEEKGIQEIAIGMTDEFMKDLINATFLPNSISLIV